MKLLAIALLAAVSLDPSQVAPDIAQRLARFQKVEMPFTYAGLSARERNVVDELIAACRDLENIYWRQSDPEDSRSTTASPDATDPKLRDAAALPLHQRQPLRSARREQAVRRQRADAARPRLCRRVSRAPRSRRTSQAHPEEKKAIYDQHTVVEIASRNPLRLRRRRITSSTSSGS